jgi:hypothetical protein
MFKQCDVCAPLAPPLLRGLQKLRAYASTLKLTPHGEFYNMTEHHLAMHWVRWPIEPGVYETDDFSMELSNERDALVMFVQRMLMAFSISFRDHSEIRNKEQL